MNQTAVDSYLPATEVGRHFGYTKDYILMLIKQGKIDGKKVKNKWHANLKSAEAHFEKAKRLREQRRKKLSDARKAELKSHQSDENVSSVKDESLNTTQVVATAVARKNSISAETNLEFTKSFVTPQYVAVLQTALIIGVGLTVGVLGYLGTIQNNETAGHNYFERVAISVHTAFSPAETIMHTTHERVAETAKTDDVDTEYSNAASVALSMQVSTTTHTSIVIDADEVVTTTTVDTIESSVQGVFSDDVEVVVDSEDDNAVLVTPKFIDGDGETQRFRIVPEDYESNSNNE